MTDAHEDNKPTDDTLAAMGFDATPEALGIDAAAEKELAEKLEASAMLKERGAFAYSSETIMAAVGVIAGAVDAGMLPLLDGSLTKALRDEAPEHKGHGEGCAFKPEVADAVDTLVGPISIVGTIAAMLAPIKLTYLHTDGDAETMQIMHKQLEGILRLFMSTLQGMPIQRASIEQRSMAFDMTLRAIVGGTFAREMEVFGKEMGVDEARH
jgi:hypothetical protein